MTMNMSVLSILLFLLVLLLALDNAKVNASKNSAKKTTKKEKKEKTTKKGKKGTPTPTNTNVCLVTVGGIAAGIQQNPAAFDACTGLLGSDAQQTCCAPVVEAYSIGCFCNPSMEVLFGPELVGALDQFLPLCRAVIPAMEVKCKKLRTHDYGCQTEDMALDAARLSTFSQIAVIFSQTGTDQCFDFENIKAQFELVFDDTPAIIVPYGIGTYTGIDKMIEYFGTSWFALNRNFYFVGPSISLGGAFSLDGKTFNSQGGISGAFALGQITFGNPLAGQPIASSYQTFSFEKCSTKIKTLEVLPSSGIAFLATNYMIMADEFNMWGIDAICEYHEKVCRPAEAASYANKAACMAVIGNLPRYSEACGPNRPFSGNSLGCKIKHVFMTALVPANHCAHIAPENTKDSEGFLKCVDAIECPAQFSPADYEQLLDGTAQAFGQPIGSNYVDQSIVTDPANNLTFNQVYMDAKTYSDNIYATQGWQPPVLCP